MTPRRKRPSFKQTPPAKPAEDEQMPMFIEQAGASELRVLPHELRPGDVVRERWARAR